MSKGSGRRPTDYSRFSNGWDRIFDHPPASLSDEKPQRVTMVKTWAGDVTVLNRMVRDD